MAPPITPAANPQPRPCALAALVGAIRLVASVSAATVVAIFDLVFMALSLWEFRGPEWSSCELVGPVRQRFSRVEAGLRGLCEKSPRRSGPDPSHFGARGRRAGNPALGDRFPRSFK